MLDGHIVAIKFGRERVERLDAAVHAVAILHPVVEQRSQARGPVWPFRHGSAEAGSHGCWIGHVVLESGGGHPTRNLHAVHFGQPSSAFLKQQVESRLPTT